MPKPSTPESSTTEVVTPRLFLDVATVYDAPEVREVLSDYRRAEMAELAACAVVALPAGPYPVGTWLSEGEPQPEAPAWTAARMAVAVAALERATVAVACAEELTVALARTAVAAADEAAGADDAEMLVHPVDYREQAERQALALAEALRRADLAVAAGLTALSVDVPGGDEEDAKTPGIAACV